MTHRLRSLIVRLCREAQRAGRCHANPQPGDAVIEVTTRDANAEERDDDAIGILAAHGHAPYRWSEVVHPCLRDCGEKHANGCPNATREVWDLLPLSGRRGANGPLRWENAEFMVLPGDLADLVAMAIRTH